MSEIKQFLEKIKSLNSNEILSKNMTEFREIIKEQVTILFPNLNKSETIILQDLSIFLLNFISKRFLIGMSDIDIIKQYSQNNYRDIKAIILMLLPYIDDKEKNKKFKMIKELNQIVYNKLGATEIKNDILKKNITDTLKNEFIVSNFGIGLLNEYSKDNLLQLKNDENTIMEEIIYHNFMGLLETIRICNGKLYVNWVNVVPISDLNFENDEIFKNTVNNQTLPEYLRNFNTNPEYIKNFDLTYNGLSLGDLYNVFRKGYYQNVKKVKWLIFNTNNKYFLQKLNIALDLNKILNSDFESYLDLKFDDRFEFDKKLEKFILTISNNDDAFEVSKALVIFFINSFRYKNEIIDSYDKKNILEKFILNDEEYENNDEDYSDNDFKMVENLTVEDILEAFKFINNEFIWDFLKDTLEYFKTTIYSTFIIKNNIIDNDFFYVLINKDGNEIDSKINLKNLYNIGKLLSYSWNPNRIIEKDNWFLLPENFIALRKKDKYDFLSKFQIRNPSTIWLNINKNLQIETNNGNIAQRYNEINEGWNELKFHFVFLYLTRKGLLTKFITDFQITDKSSLPMGYLSKNKRVKDLMINKFKQNKNWNDCYYFLTNEKYSNLKNIRVDNSVVKIKEYDYFTYIAKETNWYNFYAMDWLTQISFFHTYIYHQIMYVTGSTGQGKSTQVPKLLLYAMNMIDYKDNGKIICTQPRIPPTINNAERISYELGIPIVQPSYTIDKAKTNNFYLQYKYQDGQHLTKNTNLGSIKIVTDGSLFVEIKNNIFLREKVKSKGDYVYSLSNNEYDIVIIDEAHEHNKNMDLILSLARNSCYLNTSIKLIIISATMDDDEPIYRSYFKSINDNLRYPVREEFSYNPFVDNASPFFPQSIYMDRRFHISPPGETTQYVITEKYLDLPEDHIDEEINSKNAQDKSYQVVIDICNKSENGEILLFSTGTKEIREAVEYLNKFLPSGNVALPYFGTMNEKYKNIIEKIDKNISKIQNKRENIANEWKEEFIQDDSVSLGIYKRAIIVATNVAEASVTIPRLEYVIDNGYAKESNFDEETQISSLKVEKISESSRIQRRGRVGRIGDGTVYYMYKKDARLNIKPKYKINQDKKDDIINNLSSRDNKNDEYNIVYLKFLDPNLYEIFYQIIAYAKLKIEDENLWSKIDKNDIKTVVERTLNMEGVFNLLNIENLIIKNSSAIINIVNSIKLENTEEAKNNFWNLIKNYNKKYFIEPYYFKYRDTSPFFTYMFEDGFPLNTIIDIEGKFYLIHPYENKIIRNCMGKIIKFIDNNEEVLSDKVDEKLYLTSFKRSNIKLQLVNTGLEEIKDYQKTLLCDKIEELKQKIGKSIANDEEILTILYSYGNNVLDETIMILAILKACDYSLKRLAVTEISKKGKVIYKFNELKEKFPTQKSDLESLYKITQRFKKEFYYLKVFNLEEGKNIYDKSRKYYNELILKFKNSKSNLLDPPKELEKEWNLLLQLKDEGIINEDSGFFKWLRYSKYLKNEVLSEINENLYLISEFSEGNLINKDLLLKFIETYLNLKIDIYTIDQNEIDLIKYKNPFQWFDDFKGNFNQVYGYLSDVDKIIESFSFGYSINLGIKLDFNDDYCLMISPAQKNKIQPLFPGSKDNETFLKMTSPLVIYLNISKFSTLRVITNVNSESLVKSNPLYFNRLNFKNIYLLRDFQNNISNIKEINGDLYNIFLHNLSKNDLSKKIVLYLDYNKDVDSDLSDIDVNLKKYIDTIFTKLSYTL